MTQHPHDQLAKQVLEELLRPYGSVQRSLEIPGEPKWVDLWFTPDLNLSSTQPYSNLMANLVRSPCLLEPYRNPPSRKEVKSCLLKLFWVQDNIRRIQSQGSAIDRQETQLWIRLLFLDLSWRLLGQGLMKMLGRGFTIWGRVWIRILLM